MNGPDNLISRNIRRYLPAVAAVLAIIAVPLAAYAVPGSGPMVSVDSYNGENITELYNIIAKICLGILILVEGVLFVAIFKFRRRSDDEQPERVHGNFKLELGWTLAALIIQVFIGFKTVDVMFEVEQEPEQDPEIVVEAIAYQWNWKFRYPEQEFRGQEFGGFTTSNLVIPANSLVELDVTSEDVLHALFIPELGVKIDAVPGRYNYWWVNAAGPNSTADVDYEQREPQQREQLTTTRTDYLSFLRPQGTPRSVAKERPEQGVSYLGGKDVPEVSPFAKYDAREYTGNCAELCGSGHWNMYFRTVAMTPSSFEQWLVDRRKAAQSADADGAAVYSANCAQCHQGDGQGLGAQFPPLVDTQWTNEDTDQSRRKHINVVLMGSNAESLQGDTTVAGQTYSGVNMASHSQLNDAEVAAVVNHERTSWGNSGGTISPDDVKKVREELGLEPRPVVRAGEVAPATLKQEGERLYSACVSCHGEKGTGVGQAPGLVNSPKVLGTVQGFAETLLTRWGVDNNVPGSHSPMGRRMSNRELAALMTYVRQAWGNEGSPIQPPEIQNVRKQFQSNE